MEEESSRKWFEKHWIIWILTIFITPFGLFFLWRFSRYGLVVKILATFFFGGAFLIGVSDFPSKTNRPAQKEVQEETLNMGITYEKFKTRYSALLNKYALPENLNLMSEKYDEKTGIYQSSINGRAVMECTVDPQTGYLKKIAVSARPFIIDDKETKVELLLIQSTTFSIAVAVVNPAMEDMSYREDVIKNLYSNVHTTEYRMVGNLKCKADRRGEVITLSAIPVS